MEVNDLQLKYDALQKSMEVLLSSQTHKSPSKQPEGAIADPVFSNRPTISPLPTQAVMDMDFSVPAYDAAPSFDYSPNPVTTSFAPASSDHDESPISPRPARPAPLPPAVQHTSSPNHISNPIPATVDPTPIERYSPEHTLHWAEKLSEDPYHVIAYEAAARDRETLAQYEQSHNTPTTVPCTTTTTYSAEVSDASGHDQLEKFAQPANLGFVPSMLALSWAPISSTSTLTVAPGTLL